MINTFDVPVLVQEQTDCGTDGVVGFTDASTVNVTRVDGATKSLNGVGLASLFGQTDTIAELAKDDITLVNAVSGNMAILLCKDDIYGVGGGRDNPFAATANTGLSRFLYALVAVRQARQVRPGTARRGAVRRGAAGYGLARQVWHSRVGCGSVRLGASRVGMAGAGWIGVSRQDIVRCGLSSCLSGGF